MSEKREIMSEFYFLTKINQQFLLHKGTLKLCVISLCLILFFQSYNLINIEAFLQTLEDGIPNLEERINSFVFASCTFAMCISNEIIYGISRVFVIKVNHWTQLQLIICSYSLSKKEEKYTWKNQRWLMLKLIWSYTIK